MEPHESGALCACSAMHSGESADRQPTVIIRVPPSWCRFLDWHTRGVRLRLRERV